MASAAALMKRMEINTPVKGVGGLLMDGAIGFGASYAMGQAYTRYHEKSWGKNIPRIAAAAGKAGAVLCSYLAGGHQTFVGAAMNSVGQAGLNAIGLEYGLKHAREATGKKAVLIPSGANTKSIPGASDVTHVGALGMAPRGKGLSWDQIQEIAQGH